MNFDGYILLGIGVAISVLGFFLKRIKEQVDNTEKNSNEVKLKLAECLVKVDNLEKLTEDRREDVRKLYDIISKKG